MFLTFILIKPIQIVKMVNIKALYIQLFYCHKTTLILTLNIYLVQFLYRIIDCKY
jgi:hypothetical protein